MGAGDAVAFDMGGTSCDVSLIREGRPGRSTEREVAGLPVRLPMLDIHTVGAGGGSIAWIDDGGALRVGPQSAGADPGPACYGRGGDLPTVTDANLVLGRLDAAVPLAGSVGLDAKAARRAVATVADGFASVRAAAARDRGGGEPGDGAGDQGGVGGARARPARVRADRVRRGRPAACLRGGRGAGDAVGARARRQRGAVGARHRGRRAAAGRRAQRDAAAGGADPIADPVAGAVAAGGARLGAVGGGRPALRRAGVRAGGRPGAAGDAGRAVPRATRRAVRARAARDADRAGQPAGCQHRGGAGSWSWHGRRGSGRCQGRQRCIWTARRCGWRRAGRRAEPATAAGG